MSKNYKLFISHSWDYSDSYKKLKELLDNDPTFSYVDHSVPKDDPIHTDGTDSELESAISSKIRGCSAIIVLAGVYSTYSKWIKKEIDIAKNIYSKPIIAVKPWSAERISSIVKENADSIVGWNSCSIINAIRQHCN